MNCYKYRFALYIEGTCGDIYLYLFIYIYWGIIGIFRRCLGGPCRVGFTLYIGIARVRIYIYCDSWDIPRVYDKDYK